MLLEELPVKTYEEMCEGRDDPTYIANAKGKDIDNLDGSKKSPKKKYFSTRFQ